MIIDLKISDPSTSGGIGTLEVCQTSKSSYTVITINDSTVSSSFCLGSNEIDLLIETLKFIKETNKRKVYGIDD